MERKACCACDPHRAERQVAVPISRIKLKQIEVVGAKFRVFYSAVPGQVGVIRNRVSVYTVQTTVGVP